MDIHPIISYPNPDIDAAMEMAWQAGIDQGLMDKTSFIKWDSLRAL